jgi:hypothetical protein
LFIDPIGGLKMEILTSERVEHGNVYIVERPEWALDFTQYYDPFPDIALRYGIHRGVGIVAQY